MLTEFFFRGDRGTEKSEVYKAAPGTAGSAWGPNKSKSDQSMR